MTLVAVGSGLAGVVLLVLFRHWLWHAVLLLAVWLREVGSDVSPGAHRQPVAALPPAPAVLPRSSAAVEDTLVFAAVVGPDGARS